MHLLESMRKLLNDVGRVEAGAALRQLSDERGLATFEQIDLHHKQGENVKMSRIKLIKMIRMCGGLGLKDAKRLADNFIKRLKLQDGPVYTDAQRQSSRDDAMKMYCEFLANTTISPGLALDRTQDALKEFNKVY